MKQKLVKNLIMGMIAMSSCCLAQSFVGLNQALAMERINGNVIGEQAKRKAVDYFKAFQEMTKEAIQEDLNESVKFNNKNSNDMVKYGAQNGQIIRFKENLPDIIKCDNHYFEFFESFVECHNAFYSALGAYDYDFRKFDAINQFFCTKPFDSLNKCFGLKPFIGYLMISKMSEYDRLSFLIGCKFDILRIFSNIYGKNLVTLEKEYPEFAVKKGELNKFFKENSIVNDSNNESVLSEIFKDCIEKEKNHVKNRGSEAIANVEKNLKALIDIYGFIDTSLRNDGIFKQVSLDWDTFKANGFEDDK